MPTVGYLSQQTQPVLMANLVAGTSYAQANSTSVDLSAYDADSLFVVAAVTATTLTGFTMTAQGGATTSALGGYCVAAGSTSSLLTVATTNPAKLLFIDIKNARHRYVGVKHTGLAATNGVILGFPYNSKKQPVPLSTDLSSTVSGTGFYQSVSPTTA